VIFLYVLGLYIGLCVMYDVSCVWCSHYIGNRVSTVAFYKKAAWLYDTLDYKSRLIKLGIESLEMPQLRQDCIWPS